MKKIIHIVFTSSLSLILTAGVAAAYGGTRMQHEVKKMETHMEKNEGKMEAKTNKMEGEMEKMENKIEGKMEKMAAKMERLKARKAVLQKFRAALMACKIKTGTERAACMKAAHKTYKDDLKALKSGSMMSSHSSASSVMSTSSSSSSSSSSSAASSQ